MSILTIIYLWGFMVSLIYTSITLFSDTGLQPVDWIIGVCLVFLWPVTIPAALLLKILNDW